MIAEGCTASGFETWVLVQNPGTRDANIDLTYMTPSGPVQGGRHMGGLHPGEFQ